MGATVLTCSHAGEGAYQSIAEYGTCEGNTFQPEHLELSLEMICKGTTQLELPVSSWKELSKKPSTAGGVRTQE